MLGGGKEEKGERIRESAPEIPSVLSSQEKKSLVVEGKK